MPFEIFFLIVGLTVGAVIVLLIARKLGKKAPERIVTSGLVADRVRTVGKLVGLEVHAKEIATSTKGWSWLPPIILSQAKLAMIFQFDKQYYVDLSRLRAEHVEDLGDGRWRLTLPAIEGTLRLSDVTPYGIQAGRILGLLDVIQMNAETQGNLIRIAQEQAAQLFTDNEARYLSEAERAVSDQLASLLRLLEIEAEVVFTPRDPEDTIGGRIREVAAEALR